MRIAVPLVEGKLSLHFGHCDKFAVIDVDDNTKEITNRSDVTPPAHAPGVLPKWLAAQFINVILAGGMGMRAKELLEQKGIEVVIGANGETPEQLVTDYLQGTLQTGQNVCDH